MAKELYLYNPIVNFVAEGLISQINDNEGESVTLRVNSQGGDPLAGYGICAKLQEHGDVNIKADGSADSMTFFMMLFAKSAECLDVTTFTMHRAAFRSWVTPTAEEQSNLDRMNAKFKAMMLKRIDADLFKTVTKHTIEDMFEAEERIDITIDASQAKKLGIVQKVVKLTPAQVDAFNERMAIAAEKEPEEKPQPNKMNKEEIKSKYPDVYASIAAEGAATELDRVNSVMVFADADPKMAAEIIAGGKPMTATQIAEFTRKLVSGQNLKDIGADSAEDIDTNETDVPEKGKEAKAKTEAETRIAAFEAEVKANLKK